MILTIFASIASTSSTVNQGSAVKSTPVPSMMPMTKGTHTPSATPKSKPTPTPAAIPTKGVAQNSKISVNAQYQGIYYESNQFMQPKPGNKYVQFYVTVTNIDYPDEQIANQFFFKLFDSNYEGHGPATPSFSEGGLTSIMNSHPGEKTAGTVIFAIKQNAQPVKLVYDDDDNELTINV